jgi:hypothetical protein
MKQFHIKHKSISKSFEVYINTLVNNFKNTKINYIKNIVYRLEFLLYAFIKAKCSANTELRKQKENNSLNDNYIAEYEKSKSKPPELSDQELTQIELIESQLCHI